MFSVVIECSRGESDEAVARLYEIGTSGILEEDLPEGHRRLRAYFEDADASLILLDLPVSWNARAEAEEQHDWNADSREQWRPVSVGSRLWLAPAWDVAPVPDARIRIEMPAGLAFGTGLHVSTQLALEAAERLLRPGDAVLDLGTGSGILCIAVARLGAGAICGCDIDSDAVAAAGQTTREAGVVAALFCGTARALRRGCIDLVLANINAATIISLAAEIARVLRRDGRAAVTGFPRNHSGRVRAALEKAGLAIREELQKDNWTCLTAWSRA